MDSKKLEVFVTAVDLGSFSKASEVVGYTQSGLTHLVNSLEREMGVTLIQRSHSGISLSKEGAQLMPAIRRFLRANTGLQNEIEAIRQNQAETIRIAAYASIAMQWMPEILYRYRRDCPHVDVDLRMVDHALEPFEMLEKGETDVIFASRQDFDTCDWMPLYQERMFVVLPKNHPLAGCTEFDLRLLQGQELLIPYAKFDKEIHAALFPLGITVREKPCYVDDETVVRMVGKGLGITMMTELMIRGKTDDIRCIPVKPAVSRELGMGMRKGISRNEPIRMLEECVTRFIEELPLHE